MLFYLTTLNLVKFLIEYVSKLLDKEFDVTIIKKFNAWKHNDLLCKNYMLNG
jgi:hypothetical protein